MAALMEGLLSLDKILNGQKKHSRKTFIIEG